MPKSSGGGLVRGGERKLMAVWVLRWAPGRGALAVGPHGLAGYAKAGRRVDLGLNSDLPTYWL